MPVAFKDILRAVTAAGQFDAADIAGAPTRLGKAAGKGEQSVLQGSSSLFDRMSTKFIGSNEGSWAQGWGLYFTKADSARQYYSREYSTLTDLNTEGGDRTISRKYLNAKGETRDLVFPGQRRRPEGDRTFRTENKRINDSNLDVSDEVFNSDEFFEHLVDNHREIDPNILVEDMIAVAKSRSPDKAYQEFDQIRRQFMKKSGQNFDAPTEALDTVEDTLSKLLLVNEKSFKPLAEGIRPLNPKGYRYEAAIPVDDILMDFDGVNDGLFERLPELVEDLEALDIPWKGRQGTQVYTDLVLKTLANDNPFLPEDMSDRALNAILDNDPTLYDPNDSGELFGYAQQAASKFLRDRGVPGHRYDSGSGNQNYVVYDDAAVRALSRQEGFANPAAMGAAGFAVGVGLVLLPNGEEDSEAVTAYEMQSPKEKQMAAQALQGASQQAKEPKGLSFSDYASAALSIGEAAGRGLLGTASRLGGVLNPLSTPEETHEGAESFMEGYEPSQGLIRLMQTEGGEKVAELLNSVSETTAPLDNALESAAESTRLGNLNMVLRDVFSPI